MQEKCMGLDLSLSSTGICVGAGKPECDYHKALSNKLRGIPRLAMIRDKVVDIAKYYKPAIICIEGYAFGRQNGREAAGELGGVVKVALSEAGYDVVVVSPGQLKKFATGSGNADKIKVATSVLKRWGVTFDSDDETDAFVLHLIAAALSDKDALELTAYQKEVVQAILEPKGANEDDSDSGKRKGNSTKGVRRKQP